MTYPETHPTRTSTGGPLAPATFLSERILPIVILVVTAVLALATNYYTMMNHDEFVEFYTDSQASIPAVIHVQLTTPVSLDPFVYHLVSHLSMNVFGKTAFAERFCSLVGFLLMQVCIFLFVWRCSAPSAAIIAMILPVLSAGFVMAQAGRPYGMLLGLNAAALLCWQTSARSAGWTRSMALVGLALSLALSINTHYFGLLILIPICAAEIARSMEIRAVDKNVWFSIALGVLSLLFLIPFSLVARGRLPYLPIEKGYIRTVYETYSSFFIAGVGSRAIGLTIDIILVSVVILAIARGRWRAPMSARSPEWVALVALFALPVFGVALGMLFSHTFAPRYVIGTVLGASALFGIILEHSLPDYRAARGMIAFLSICAIVLSCRQTLMGRSSMVAMQRSMELAGPVETYLSAHKDSPIYIGEPQFFFQNNYYCTNPLLRGRFRLLYDPSSELRWLRTDAASVTIVYLSRISDLKVTPYKEFETNLKDKPVLEYKDEWEWIGKQFASERDTVTEVGPILRGMLASVSAPK